MEFCEYSLDDIINMKNTFDSSLNAINYYISSELFREVLECVQYLHSRDPPIIHRDLKPQNILITMNGYKSGRFVKLCDFGIAVEHKFHNMSHTSKQGTAKYMSPEVEKGRKYNTKADIYSLGIIIEDMFYKFDENS